MNCIKCGKEHNDYHFRVLQVQTLHVRDLDKSKRVQALGGFEEYTVCADCARKRYDGIMAVSATVRKLCLIWGAVMVLGLVLTMLSWKDGGYLRMAGLGALIGGCLVLFGQLQNATRAKRELMRLGREEGLARCAWLCMIDGAPKKNDLNNITYIPVDEKTLARKNGDLMILYDLLPEIAIQAHKRLHGLEEAE